MPHKARKRFGQNFLTDEMIIHQIVNAISPQQNDQLVEIGPGLGALTGPLLEHLHHLTVIELDRDLIPNLNRQFNHDNQLTIHQQDALNFDFASLVTPGKKLRIVGNLPYNISTPLLFHLLSYENIIADMHFMLQKEVVDRLSAQLNTKDYGRLTIMVQYHCEVKALFLVPPSAFTPQPRVNSAIVRLIPHAHLPHKAANFARFLSLVRAAFNQRRKTIRHGLDAFITAPELESIGIDPKLRPEALSIAKFIQIDQFLETRVRGSDKEGNL